MGGALENQASGPPVSDTEMACRGQTWPDIAVKLATVKPLARAQLVPNDMKAMIAESLESYPNLFKKVYGDPEISQARIVMAIATHERRLTSDLTPWDRFNAGETTALTPAQQRGFALFNTKARCNQCHQAPLFPMPRSAGRLSVGTSDGFHKSGSSIFARHWARRRAHEDPHAAQRRAARQGGPSTTAPGTAPPSRPW